MARTNERDDGIGWDGAGELGTDDDEGAATAPARDPRAEARALARKAKAIRRDVDQLIAATDPRRRWLPGPLRAHPLATAGFAFVLGGAAVAGAIFLLARREARAQLRPGALARVLGRIVDERKSTHPMVRARTRRILAGNEGG